jgi:hypothetical protein
MVYKLSMETGFTSPSGEHNSRIVLTWNTDDIFRLGSVEEEVHPCQIPLPFLVNVRPDHAKAKTAFADIRSPRPILSS